MFPPAKTNPPAEVVIAPEQTTLVAQLQAQVNAAQQQLNLVLGAILAGHGITDGQVRQLDVDRNVLVVQCR